MHSYHTIHQSHSLVFTQMNRKLMSTKYLHVDVDRDFIHNYQNLETRYLSVEKMNK